MEISRPLLLELKRVSSSLNFRLKMVSHRTREKFARIIDPRKKKKKKVDGNLFSIILFPFFFADEGPSTRSPSPILRRLHRTTVLLPFDRVLPERISPGWSINFHYKRSLLNRPF